jgi:hypothetical protein
MTAKYIEAVQSVIKNATQMGRTILRARIIWKEMGHAKEEVIMLRRLSEADIRPVEAAWRVERLRDDGIRNGKFLWFSLEGQRV